MATTHFATGTAAIAAVGGTTISPAFPINWAEGDLGVICVATGHTTEDTPTIQAGWDNSGSFSGGGGTFGAGAGPRRITFFTRELLTGDDTTPTVTCTGVSSMIGAVTVLRKDTGDGEWVLASAFGEDTTQGASFSATCSADPGITADDFVVLGYAIRDTTTFSAQAITTTGITYGTITERLDSATENGNDLALSVATGGVTSGTSSAAPVIDATLGTNETGAAGVLRVRTTPGLAHPGVAGVTVAAGDITTPSVNVSYITNSIDITNASSYTFTGISIGTAAADRVVVVVAIAESETTGSPDFVSGITIGGNAMTYAAGSNSTANDTDTPVAIFYLPVSSGTTADVVVTYSQTMARCLVGIWTLTNAAETPTDTDFQTAASGTGLTLSLNIPSGAAGIAGYATGTAVAHSWANATERFDVSAEGALSEFSGADSKVTGAPTSITTSNSSSTQVITAAGAVWSLPSETVAATASSTAIANNPGSKVDNSTGNAPVTVAAGNAAVGVSASAGVAVVAIAAESATTTVSTGSGVATVSAAVEQLSADIKTTSTDAPIGAVANNATVQTSGGTIANAGVASVTVTAEQPSISVKASAGVATITAEANGATIAVIVSPSTATITATANGTTTEIDCGSGTAGVVTAAVDIDANGSTTPTASSVGVVAHNPTVETGSFANAQAQTASVSVVAGNNRATVTASIECATATVTSNGQSVSVLASAAGVSVITTANDSGITRTGNPTPTPALVGVASNAAKTVVGPGAGNALVAVAVLDASTKLPYQIPPPQIVVRDGIGGIVVKGEADGFVVRKRIALALAEAEGKKFVVIDPDI